jgi:glycosyltransferase involved in cell wall biosynthesis
MKIAIDISQIVYGTGVSEYTKNLVNSLLKVDKQNEYVLFGTSLRRRGDILKHYPSAKVFPIPPSALDILWNKLHVLPVEKLIGKIDVLHTSDWTEPPSAAFKVTTVHDLAPFLYPNLFPRDLLRNIVETHRTKLSWVKEESRRIIAPTVATRDDLVKLGFDEAKIRVIPEAARELFYPRSELEINAVKSKYRLHGKYMLCVGIDPRKNTSRIIKAFEQAKAGKDIKLIFVGQPKYQKIAEGRNVRILGHVTPEELASLYSGAVALIYASLYEGFGLPILEAMSCGCPVITSNISSMKEVAGDAAILVDPYEVESIKDAIEKVIRGVKSFKEKGIKHVKKYSWTATALETLKVYKEAGV